MRKRIFCFALCAMLFALSFPAEAQEPGKIHRIGYLSVRWPDTEKSYLPAFQLGLRELGYLEGKNIVIEYRWAERRGRERQSILAAELLRHEVELVVTGGGGAALAVQRLSKTIPIVMAEATAPVARGLVQSLARPGGNITGLSLMPPELFGKWLELLKEVVPNLSAVAVLWRPKNITSRLGWNAIQLPARQLKVQLHSIEVRSPNDDVVKIFQEAERARVGALVSMPAVYKKLLADLEAKIHLPAIYINSRFVESGGLMSYGPNWADVYHRAATYVDKILKGAKPADLPVEQPRKYVLTINLKTAKKLGLTISPDMLYRADKVIK